jgi:hypothetical protein
VPRTLEFLDEAIEDAEAAARWYAERSQTAAGAFADEIDSAIAEITRLSAGLACLQPQYAAVPAAEISLQRRVSRFGEHHPDRRGCPPPSSTGLLEGPSGVVSEAWMSPAGMPTGPRESREPTILDRRSLVLWLSETSQQH